MKRKAAPKRKTHFVLGHDLQSDGHVRVTKGEDFLVHGGTARSHKETVDIIGTFSEKLQKEGDPDFKAAREILIDILKKKGYTPAPSETPKTPRSPRES